MQGLAAFEWVDFCCLDLDDTLIRPRQMQWQSPGDTRVAAYVLYAKKILEEVNRATGEGRPNENITQLKTSDNVPREDAASLAPGKTKEMDGAQANAVKELAERDVKGKGKENQVEEIEICKVKAECENRPSITELIERLYTLSNMEKSSKIF